MVLLNIRTEITLPSGFEISVCKMQKDPRSSAGLARSTKFGYCYADPVQLFLYLSLLSFCLIYCLLYILVLCLLNCLAQASPGSYQSTYRMGHVFPCLLILEETETSGRHTCAHATYLSRISICFLQIQNPRRNFKRCICTNQNPYHLRARALLITSNCPHPPQFQHSYHPALL